MSENATHTLLPTTGKNADGTSATRMCVETAKLAARHAKKKETLIAFNAPIALIVLVARNQSNTS